MLIDITNFSQEISEKLLSCPKKQVKAWANRRTGVGFDQLLLLERVGMQYRVFNADGSQARQCGNGLHAVAHYLDTEGYYPDETVELLTPSDPVQITKQFNRCEASEYRNLKTKEYTVNMGIPQRLMLEKGLGKLHWDNVFLEVGNKHLVVFCNALDTLDLEAWLSDFYRTYSNWETPINVEFVDSCIDNQPEEEIRIRIYENGIGETLACGTGACAAMVATKIKNLHTAEDCRVVMPGGEVIVSWAGEGYPLFLTGSATRVFTGIIQSKDFELR